MTHPATCWASLSLVLWSLIVVVTLKYVLFVMRADNRGEGGILALLALAGQSDAGKHGQGRAWAWCWCWACSARRCSSATA